MNFDDIDKALFDLLHENGRITNREISRTLNISESSARQRMKRLLDEKIIRLDVVQDALAAGKTANMVIRIKCMPSKAKQIAQAIGQIEQCHFATFCIGRFDILAFLMGGNRVELAAIVESQIAALPGIQALEVKEMVGVFKYNAELAHIL